MSIIVNDTAITSFIFPGGECHVSLGGIPISAKTRISALLTSSEQLMCLLLTVNAIRHINPTTMIELLLPYVPYARQDRVCNKGEALSIQVLASLINSLRCDSVTIYDPHSDVTSALLNHCTIVSQAELFAKTDLPIVACYHQAVLLSPDAGAEKKVRSVAKSLTTPGYKPEVIYAGKTRDPATGEITGTQIHGDVTGRNIVILDDICDGGRTFIALAEQLRSMGAADLYLYVTHGIFSKGLMPLRTYFKAVYCNHTLYEHLDNDDGYMRRTLVF